jgi:hypothetical protein
VPKGGLQFWHLVVIVILAAMLGTAVSDIVEQTFPTSSVARFFSAGVRIGTTTPFDLDFVVAQLTFGIGLRLTVLGALGAGFALVLFFRRV